MLIWGNRNESGIQPLVRDYQSTGDSHHAASQSIVRVPSTSSYSSPPLCSDESFISGKGNWKRERQLIYHLAGVGCGWGGGVEKVATPVKVETKVSSPESSFPPFRLPLPLIPSHLSHPCPSHAQSTSLTVHLPPSPLLSLDHPRPTHSVSASNHPGLASKRTHLDLIHLHLRLDVLPIPCALECQ